MISPDLFTRIRRLFFFAEHRKVETISAELGVHPDAVRRAIESDRFVRTGRQVCRPILRSHNSSQALKNPRKPRPTRPALKTRFPQGSVGSSPTSGILHPFVHTHTRDAPSGRPVEQRPSSTAQVIALPRAGGLRHRYAWEAAA